MPTVCSPSSVCIISRSSRFAKAERSFFRRTVFRSIRDIRSSLNTTISWLLYVIRQGFVANVTFGSLSLTAFVNAGGRGLRGRMRFETSYGSAGPGTNTKCISLAHFGYANNKSAKAEKFAVQVVQKWSYKASSCNDLGSLTHLGTALDSFHLSG